MITPENRQAAERLSAGRLHHTLNQLLPEAARPGDLLAAYAVQDALHEIYLNGGHGSLAGYKIGCTTPVMQSYLGIDHPCAGGLLASTCHRSPGNLPMADYCRPGVECEIAVELGADLPPQAKPFDQQTVASAVAGIAAAIEIVDDRYDDYRRFDTPTLVADDFFGAGCVLGPFRQDWQDLDLAALGGSMVINGTSVGSGVGADIMGHPFAALAWLATHAASRGKPLQAGMIILLGSVVQTEWVSAGDVVDIAIENLGTVQARFT